jgi:hypothetical protein
MVLVDPGPRQDPISEERIQQMLEWIPRRFRLADITEPLKEPGRFGNNDWNLLFPFRETFVAAFEVVFPVIDHIPFRSKVRKTELHHVSEECRGDASRRSEELARGNSVSCCPPRLPFRVLRFGL